MNQLKLHIPTENELKYRRQLISDEDTMAYNMGYGDNGGCTYYQTDMQVRQWYQSWNKDNEHFYAYIVRTQDNTHIGEVNAHRSNGADWYEMGIVLEAKYRGLGYAVEALNLLFKYAFETLGARAVHNDFEETRTAAVRTHFSAGFTEYAKHDGVIELLITKEQYDRLKLEDYIKENLSGNDCKIALEFTAFLRANSLQFIKDEGACWKDKIYYWVKNDDICVCFISIMDPDEKDNRWTVWSDDINSEVLDESLVNDELKQIAWEHVDHCGSCGSCGGGRYKEIFGKVFDDVCGCTFRFDNPTENDLNFMKKVIEIQCHNFMSLNDFIEFRNVKIRDDIHRKIVSLFYPYLSSMSGDSSKLPDAIGVILNMDFSSVKAVTGCFNELSGNDYPYDNTDFYILFDNEIKVYVYGSLPLKELVHLDSDQYAVFIVSNTINGIITHMGNNHIYIQ